MPDVQPVPFKKAIEDFGLTLRPLMASSKMCTSLVDSKDYYEWYYTYGKLLKPRRYLEIGVLFGYSAIAVCSGACGPLLMMCLIDNESYADGAPIVLKDAIARISHACRFDIDVVAIKADTQAMTQLPLARGGYDLINVDGDHSFEGAIHDMEKALAVMGPGGHMVIDNVGDMPPVRLAADTFLEQHPELCALEVKHQWGHYIIHRKDHVENCPLLVRGAQEAPFASE